MSDIEIVFAAMAQIVVNFWPCFALLGAYMLWETATEPKRARIRKSSNIK